MSKFDSMGKEELRAACRTAGISYGKLNNDGMRAALTAKQTEQGIGEVGSDNRPRPVVEAAKPVAAKVETKVVETPIVEAPVVRQTTVGTVVQAKSLKIEKGRDKQNGVSRPSAGSICRSIWDQLDTARAATKAVPTFEMLRDLMKQFNWSRNTAMTQFQRWKQFHGVMPRSTEVEEEVETPAATPAADETEVDEDSQDE